MPTILDNAEHKALTTLTRQKDFLGKSGSAQDSLLTMLINQATGFIERYTGRRLLSQTYTEEQYDGTGTKVLVLRNLPVTSLTTLQQNRNFDNSDSWETVNTDYYFWDENGVITADSFTFLEAKQRYRATYVAGFLVDFANENDPALHTLPEELEYACQKIVAGVWNTRRAEGFDTSRDGDQSVRLKKQLFGDAETRAILDKYRVPVI